VSTEAPGDGAGATAEDPLRIVERVHPVHPALRGDVVAVVARVENAVRDNGHRLGALHDRIAAAERDLRMFLVDLLDVLDAFDRLRGEFAGTIAGMPRSVETTARLLERTLGRRGVRRVELVGGVLDPAWADVDEVVVDPSAPEETVVRELVAAYRWGDEPLRRGRVVVSTRTER
jgi:molecular chaperone GrpE (heat shock protein)